MSVAIKQVCSGVGRWLPRFALMAVGGVMLASCDTPVGQAPNLQGGYWQNAEVTHPNNDGPQVVRWGPPQNYNPEAGTAGGGR